MIAIDPFVDGRLFGGRATRDLFEANLERPGVTDAVTLLAEYSTRARPAWTGAVRPALHRRQARLLDAVSDDLRWAEHLPPGARVLVHDCYSSIGRDPRCAGRTCCRRAGCATWTGPGSLARFRVAPPARADRTRILAQLPWWLRNVGLKILLRLRLRPVARLLRTRLAV